MPIWLRRYTYRELKEYYDSQNKKAEQDIKTKKAVVDKPAINPSYSSKASKK